MEDSPTVDTTVDVASQTNDGSTVGSTSEPTTQSAEANPTAEVNTQDATANPTQDVEQEASVETAATQETEEKQTQTNSGEIDEGLAKFAKSQGFDPENLTEGEAKALKLAHENQKAFRKSTVATAKADVDGDVTRDELDSFRQEFRQYQATKQADAFFSQEGRDDTLAPVMSEIIEEKKAQYGADYARALSTDLELLYDLAVIKQGGTKEQIDPEAIRREERESMNKKMTGAVSQHATQNAASSATAQVTSEWLHNEYDPTNPEHAEIIAKIMN